MDINVFDFVRAEDKVGDAYSLHFALQQAIQQIINNPSINTRCFIPPGVYLLAPNQDNADLVIPQSVEFFGGGCDNTVLHVNAPSAAKYTNGIFVMNQQSTIRDLSIVFEQPPSPTEKSQLGAS